ncbi:MAG: hypothetical protein HC892_01440 [Saprospiraceae bacterium]|nr:hypothetical protein [Saprospiraceae bacterium]
MSNLICKVDVPTCGTNLTIKGKVTNCKFVGGYPSISPNGNTIIKDCNIIKYRHDGINSLIGYDSLTIINTKIDSAYMGTSSNRCEYESSTDNIHVENVPNIIIDRVYSDHSQFTGKFALIVNKGKNVTIKNSTLIGHYGHPSSAVIYLGGGATLNMDNTVILGGHYGIQNFGNVNATNCVFKYNRLNSIFQGGNKSLTNCTFVNCSGYDGASGVIRSWAFETKIINSIFINCIKPHQLTLEGFTSYGNVYNDCGKPYDANYSTQTVNFIDTIRYNNTINKGANLTIDVPTLKPFPIQPDYDNLITDLNYYKAVYDVTMKGLLNKYQTKASIIKQINNIQK